MMRRDLVRDDEWRDLWSPPRTIASPGRWGLGSYKGLSLPRENLHTRAREEDQAQRTKTRGRGSKRERRAERAAARAVSLLLFHHIQSRNSHSREECSRRLQHGLCPGR